MSACDCRPCREIANRCEATFPPNNKRQCQLDRNHAGRCEHDDGRGIVRSWDRNAGLDAWGNRPSPFPFPLV